MEKSLSKKSRVVQEYAKKKADFPTAYFGPDNKTLSSLPDYGKSNAALPRGEDPSVIPFKTRESSRSQNEEIKYQEGYDQGEIDSETGHGRDIPPRRRFNSNEDYNAYVAGYNDGFRKISAKQKESPMPNKELRKISREIETLKRQIQSSKDRPIITDDDLKVHTVPSKEDSRSVLLQKLQLFQELSGKNSYGYFWTDKFLNSYVARNFPAVKEFVLLNELYGIGNLHQSVDKDFKRIESALSRSGGDIYAASRILMSALKSIKKPGKLFTRATALYYYSQQLAAKDKEAANVLFDVADYYFQKLEGMAKQVSKRLLERRDLHRQGLPYGHIKIGNELSKIAEEIKQIKAALLTELESDIYEEVKDSGRNGLGFNYIFKSYSSYYDDEDINYAIETLLKKRMVVEKQEALYLN